MSGNYKLVNTFEWIYDDITEWVKNMCIHEEFVKSFTEAHNEYKYSIINTVNQSPIFPYTTTIEIYENIDIC